MRHLVKKAILDVKPYVPGKPIEEVKRELGLRSVIKLASNENPYALSPKVLKAMAQAAKSLNRYPDGDCFYLRKELAKHLGVGPRQLIFGNGSDEVINFAVRVFVHPGDEVIIAKPSFLIYDIASRLAGAVIREVSLVNFRYDLASMKKAVTPKTRLIFLGNPDNPAGTYLSQKDVEEFLKGLSEDILVFIDEAYFEYVTAKDYADSIKLIKKHKNIVVTRTFSKMYGLAGLRIGYGIATEGVIELLNIVREPFNINSVAQVAALACLKDQKYYKNLAKKNEIQRQYLYQSFCQLGLRFEDSCTNFILVKVEKDASDVSKALLKKGVIIRDMSFWGLKNYIRITIGTQQENRTLIKALGGIL